MTYSISNSSSAANAYLTQQTTQAKSAHKDEVGKPVSDVKPSTNAVTLSAIGQQMAAQDKTWSALSSTELKGIYDRSWDQIAQLDEKFRAIGMAAFDADVPTQGPPEKIAAATEIRNYMVSSHSLPQGSVANPYAGYSREILTSIIYDESNNYTKSEKQAAFAEQQKQDFVHFSMLYASNSTSEDHRQMFVGVLDFYDKLSPAEKSAYSANFRQQIGEYLKQEETLFGAVSESDQKTATDEQHGPLKGDTKETDEQPKKKTLFDILIESDIKTAIVESGNVSTIPILKRDEPIWKQLVELTSKLSSVLAHDSLDALNERPHLPK